MISPPGPTRHPRHSVLNRGARHRAQGGEQRGYGGEARFGIGVGAFANLREAGPWCCCTTRIVTP
jgi:hypothetical protein